MSRSVASIQTSLSSVGGVARGARSAPARHRSDQRSTSTRFSLESEVQAEIGELRDSGGSSHPYRWPQASLGDLGDFEPGPEC